MVVQHLFSYAPSIFKYTSLELKRKERKEKTPFANENKTQIADIFPNPPK
jgi:hypothetical protein